ESGADVPSETVTASRRQDGVGRDQAIRADNTPPRITRQTNGADGYRGPGQFPGAVIPTDPADAVHAGMMGLIGMQEQIACNGIHSSGSVRGACEGDDLTLWRKILPHKLAVKAQPSWRVRARANDKIAACIGEIGDAALGNAKASANIEGILWRFSLAEAVHARAHQNKK